MFYRFGEADMGDDVRIFMNGMIVCRNGSLIREQLAGDEMKECRFSRAARAQQPMDRIGLKIDANIVDSLGVSVFFRNLMAFQCVVQS
ncbi:hypothetical protein D3C77_432100 [compost metagenome]